MDLRHLLAVALVIIVAVMWLDVAVQVRDNMLHQVDQINREICDGLHWQPPECARIPRAR